LILLQDLELLEFLGAQILDTEAEDLEDISTLEEMADLV
jgi:hypothetical protein